MPRHNPASRTLPPVPQISFRTPSHIQNQIPPAVPVPILKMIHLCLCLQRRTLPPGWDTPGLTRSYGHSQTPNWVFADTNQPPEVAGVPTGTVSDANATNAPGGGGFGVAFSSSLQAIGKNEDVTPTEPCDHFRFHGFPSCFDRTECR
jgi:hypothetical protein